jgi:hypothetical protein
MKNQVKTFGQFINESKFYHAIPNGPAGLRNQFKELSQEEKDTIQDLANKINSAGKLDMIKSRLSRYRNIADMLSDMEMLADQVSSKETYGTFSNREEWVDRDTNPYRGDFDFDYDEDEYSDFDSFNSAHPQKSRSLFGGNSQTFNAYADRPGALPFKVRTRK